MTQKVVVPDQVRQAIFDNLNTGNVQNRKFWLAIAAYETGNFTSTFFAKGNNLFGMHYTPSDPYARGSVIGDGASMAVYSSLPDCVKGLNHYFGRLKWKTTTFDNLSDLIYYMKDKKYFGPSAAVYYQGVKQRYAQIFGTDVV